MLIMGMNKPKENLLLAKKVLEQIDKNEVLNMTREEKEQFTSKLNEMLAKLDEIRAKIEVE